MWAKPLVKIRGVTLHSLAAQEAGEASLTGGKFLPGLCAGDTTRGVGTALRRHHQGAERPTKGVRVTDTAKRFKSQNMWEKKMTACEKQALRSSLANRKATLSLSSVGKLANSLLPQIPKAEVQEGQWFLLMAVCFSTKTGRKQRFNT